MSHSKLRPLISKLVLRITATNLAGKRNTSLAFFTAHERNELKGHWGSRSTRLTRDSFLPFGSCQLCLLPAREPVTCSHGHLFCRECAVANLLAQNKDLKRLKKEAEKRRADDSEEQNLEDEEAKARALEDFERVQAGLSARGGGESIIGREGGKVILESGAKGAKRKLEVDEQELVAQGKSQKRLDKGWGNGEGKEDLPFFWAPGQTPDNKKADIKAIKPNPTCPAAATDKPHDFTLKTLVTVNFSTDKPGTTDTETPVRTCPSCNKVLTNSTKAILAKPCGHVLCKPCSDKFQRPAQKSAHDAQHDESVRCFVCSEDVTAGKRKGGEKEGKASKVERGLVELSSEGTGYAGGGGNMVKKSGVAFQC